ncbi:MAG: PEP-CTERM sorting domain-containing protein [Thermoguttaceae bacterium]|nr:PEP-CTERM sorting domain-containing protein [Thermoguttaceae bacterium]
MKKFELLPWAVVSEVLLLMVSFGSTAAPAAVSYTVAGQVVGQDFNSLANNPLNTTASWANDSTLPGWYVVSSTGGTFSSYKVFDGGGASQNALMSLGTIGDADRALGYQTGTGGTSIHYGLRLVNNTGVVLNDFSLQYKGEQWRAVDTPVDSLVFDYRVFPAGSGSLTAASGWTAVESLRFDSPHFHSSATENRGLNGNLPANSAQLSGTASGLYWLPGQELWLRWTDLARNPSNQNVYQMMAIDDVQFTTPETTLREVPIYFDLGPSTQQVLDPTVTSHAYGYYNNVTSQTAGLKTTDAVNVDKASTGISLSITDAFDGVTSAGTQGEVSSAAGFHEDAQQDGFFIRSFDSGAAAVRLENLDPSLVYNIDLFGSRTANAPSDRYTVYTINGMEQVLDTKGNTSDVASFFKVAPQYDSVLDGYVIDIGIRLLTGNDTHLLQLLGIESTNTDHGYLNAIRVTPVPEPGTMMLLLAALAGFAMVGRRRR